jgi:ATP-binding cassette subfamily F protein 3
MLIVNHASYSIYGRSILKDVSFTLDKERKFIIGSNGSGKTTLLEIIVGNLKSDSGMVSVTGTFAYVPQEIKGIDKTGIAVIEEGVKRIKDIEKELALLEMENEVNERYYALLEEYERLGGYTYESEIQALLSDFDLDMAIALMPLREMSGGEKTKCLIIKALLSAPDMLILDEPTNNLDIETIENLEKHLSTFKGGVLVVSHDRTLINKFADSILYLENGTIKEYPGNYDKFLKIKEIEDETFRREHEQLLKYIEKERKFIEKFRYGTRSSQALSREKQLNKIEVKEVTEKKPIKIKIESSGIGSEKAVELKDISKSFGAKIVLKDINLKIMRGERVALIGKNGSGKTTLLKIILGMIDPDTGTVYVGPSTEIMYFPQDDFILNPNNTVLDEMLKEGLLISEAYEYLALFAFQGELVSKKVSELSGGEKRRLILAKMNLAKGNFLILDEPTNYLDIETVDALISALKNYDGTILLVSHDRYLINKLTKKTYLLEDGHLKDREEQVQTEKAKDVDKEKSKEINKIKARILYLEKTLKEKPNPKKETELKILRKKLERLK